MKFLSTILVLLGIKTAPTESVTSFNRLSTNDRIRNLLDYRKELETEMTTNVWLAEDILRDIVKVEDDVRMLITEAQGYQELT